MRGTLESSSEVAASGLVGTEGAVSTLVGSSGAIEFSSAFSELDWFSCMLSEPMWSGSTWLVSSGSTVGGCCLSGCSDDLPERFPLD